MDDVRRFLKNEFKRTGRRMSDASRFLGRNHAYIQQYINRGSPQELGPRERSRLAEFLGCDEYLLGGPDPSEEPAKLPDQYRGVIEYDALTAAGDGITLEDEEPVCTWPFPVEYLEGELRLSPNGLALLPVRGDSMEPTLRSGDRIIVDTSDKNVSQPGLFVLWDGDGRVVKRVERIPPQDEDQTRLVRLLSDNPLHSHWDVPAEMVYVIGRVVCAVRRF